VLSKPKRTDWRSSPEVAGDTSEEESSELIIY
jgi:hypothetical protein